MSLLGYTMSDEEKKQLEEKVESLLKEVKDKMDNLKNLNSDEAIKSLIEIQNLLLPSILNELKNPTYNLFRTKVLDKASLLVGKMIDSSIKLREFEVKESVDVINNPKINLMFKWFIDILDDSFNELEGDFDKKEIKNKFFNVFSNKLDGWELKVEQRLKKLTFKDVINSKNIENPLKIEIKED